MSSDHTKGSPVINVLGEQFLLLMANLIKGNMKKALKLAEAARRDSENAGMKIATQTLIEDLAQAQAVKNSIINSPSIVPGLGTLLSFGLLGVENFFLLDQSVTLILSLCALHGVNIRENQSVHEFAVKVVGEVFGIVDAETTQDFRTISREYVTRTLPQKYVNAGVSSGMRKLLRRLLPFKSRSRLLPAGLGLGASALNAYETIVGIGQTTLKHLPRLVNPPSQED